MLSRCPENPILSPLYILEQDLGTILLCTPLKTTVAGLLPFYFVTLAGIAHRREPSLFLATASLQHRFHQRCRAPRRPMRQSTGVLPCGCDYPARKACFAFTTSNLATAFSRDLINADHAAFSTWRRSAKLLRRLFASHSTPSSLLRLCPLAPLVLLPTCPGYFFGTKPALGFDEL